MTITQDLLLKLETADEIMDTILIKHKKGKEITEETKIFNYIHGTIAITTYKLEELIEKYTELQTWEVK